MTSVTREYVRLSRQAFGVLYSPSTGVSGQPNVGLIVMHPNSNYLDHLAGVQMAERGCHVLCMNGRYSNTRREYMLWERVPLDVKPAVEYLRQLPGLETVVLVGHSGGGQLMPFYQQLAENDEASELPPADAVVLLDAHHGYAANTLTALDPAVVDEDRPTAIDPALDVFNPDNGYAPSGSKYSASFRERYFRAQAERMLRLTERATERDRAISEGRGLFPDDEPFLLARAQARIWQLDTSLVAHTRGSYPILMADGSTVVDIARSVRVAGVTPGAGGEPGLTAGVNASYAQGAVTYTVKSWLSSHALRVDPKRYTVTEDHMDGIDWSSSTTSTPSNLAGVRVPTLLMAMTGHYWMVSGELFFERSAATDKELVFVEGASHNITPCKACGDYGDTVKRTFDYVAGWLDERFSARA